MPSYTVPNALKLASFFHGMTPDMATKLYELADERGPGAFASAALRFDTVSASGKTKRTAMVIYLSINDSDGSAVANTDEYHPRKNGPADMIFETDYVYNPNR